MPTPKSPRRWFSRTSRIQSASPHRQRPHLEWCEPRTLLTAFTVNALTDTGAGSGTTGDLRYCITQANKDATNDTINITSTGTISLTGGLTLSGNHSVAITGPGAASLMIAGSGLRNITPLTVNSGTTASLTGLTMTGSSISALGGSPACGIGNAGTLTLTNVTLTGGSTTSGVGGITSTGTLIINNSTFSGNIGNFAGAIDSSGPLTVTNSTFANNTCAEEGTGGAIKSSGTATISGSTFTTNHSAASGGAISNSGTMTVSESSFTGNSCVATGGAILDQGSISIKNSTFTANTSGLFVLRTATVTGSTFTNNTSNAIDNNGSLILTNSTLANNHGSGLADNGTSTLTGDTITGNSGGLFVGGGKSTLVNSIVAGNTSGSTASDIAGTLVATSHNNLIGSGGSGGLSNGTNANIVLTAGQSPGLGTLGNYGGSTQTIPLLANSPALDAASDSSAGPTDQRGAQRGAAGLDAGLHADIGAYEDSSSYLVTSTADTTAAGTLRAAVGWANVNANPRNGTDPNTVRFDTANTFATPQTIVLSSALGTLALGGAKVGETITGPGAANLTVQGGGTSSNFSVFTVASGAIASLAGLSVSGGNATGANGVLAGGLENLGNTSLANMAFTGNSGYTGGAVRNDGTMGVSASTFGNNTASFGGAGLFNSNMLTVTDSTIANNTTPNVGGGIYNGGGGILALTSSTVSGNSAINGGGIETINSGSALNVVNSTIAYNSASNQGGGIDSQAQATTLLNTIVAANTKTGTTTASDISGTVNPGVFTSGSSNNMIGTGGAGGLVNGSAGNLVGVVNPKLGALGNYGGPTQTIPLLAGSPAIDAGGTSRYSNVTTDQRGAQVGPNGLDAGSGVDIGAYEDTSSYLVTSTADSLAVGTLRSAISWANLNSNPRAASDPNTIRFDTTRTFATPQTITLDPALGSLALTGSTVAEAIAGPGAATLLVKGGGSLSNFSVFTIKAGTTASLTGLTISGGNAANGGGINNAGTLTLTNSNLAANTASSPTTIGQGGGLYNAVTGIATVTGVTFRGNSAFDSQTYNGSGSVGGAIANLGTTTVTNSTFTGNSADYGGGAEGGAGTLLINGSTFATNSVNLGGGALHVSAGNVTVNGSTFTNNTATARGGAIDDVGSGAVAVNNSTLSGNSTPGSGGAIFTSVMTGGQFTLTNSTVTNNLASDGGAILTAGTGPVTLASSTIVRNSTSATAGGIDITSPNSMTLVNTIVAANTITNTTPNDLVGTVAVNSHNNLVGILGGGGGLVNGVNGNLIFSYIDLSRLALGTLGNYGGTVATIPLLPGSPAIGAGSTAANTATTDERGKARVRNGTIDIGAFQSQGFTTVAAANTTPQSSSTGYFSNPLAVLVSSSAGDPVVGGIVSYTVTPNNSGAAATLSSPIARIFASGSQNYAAVSATSNGIPGRSIVTASANGADTPAQFALTYAPLASSGSSGGSTPQPPQAEASPTGGSDDLSDPGLTFPLPALTTSPEGSSPTTPTTPMPTPPTATVVAPFVPLTTLPQIEAYNAHPIPSWLQLAHIHLGDHPTRAQIRASAHTTRVQHAQPTPSGPAHKAVAVKHSASHAAHAARVRS